jgi:hypothetical protein
MAIDPTWLKTNVYNIIMDGVSTPEEKWIQLAADLTGLTPPGVSGTITNVTAVGGVGPKSLGTYGTSGITGPKGPGALTLSSIDQIVTNSRTTNELRKRIVKIAASYIGQNELPGNNLGWYDPKFEIKMKSLKVPWQKTHAWCNYFTNLCWTEAYTTGNSLVPSTTAYQSIWNTKLNKGAYGKPLTPGVFNTLNGFAAMGQAITISEATSGRKLPEPGDMVVFNFGHIEIVVATKITGGKLTGISTIGGNTSSSDPRDGGGTQYHASMSLGTVKGFCRVIF